MADIIIPVYGGMFDSTTVVDTVNGFPRGDKAVDSAFFAKMISSFYSDGILAGGNYAQSGFGVTAAGGMAVTVTAGIAWIRGYMAWMQTAQSFTLRSGHSYSILLRLNAASGEFNLIAAEDASGLPADTELVRDLVLAEITIPSSSTSLADNMILDTRGDRTKCGFVTCSVDALQSVPFASDAGSVGGVPEGVLMRKTGGRMLGGLIAAPETTGISVVRNIAYGTTLPDVLDEGEIFILLAE